MININDYLEQLSEESTELLIKSETEQKQLFEQYVLKNEDHKERRLELEKRYKAGESLTGDKGLRKRLAAIDLEYFGRAYLPHYFVRKSPSFHSELDQIWAKGVMKSYDPILEKDKISRLNGCRRGIAAPRGHAKSTTFTFKGTLHAALYEYKHYCILLSDSSDQADGFLSDIKTELEENEIIREDFGKLDGKVWKSNVILLHNGVKIESIGSGKKIRGRRHRNWRPDLIVMDDVENDENVATPEQRRKLKSWFDKAVSKAGDTYTDIVVIGTILHYASLLSGILENGTYLCKKYRGVISFAKNTTLWNAWEEIYNDLFNDDREAEALEFFKANEIEMLEGSEVLWVDKNPYYALMVTKLESGEAAFNSEIQNDPIDPENCAFQEEWFDYYEDEQIEFTGSHFVFVAANDPSLGKNKKSDTSAIITLAVDSRTKYIYVVEASIERRKPDVIIDDAIELSKRLKRDYRSSLYKFGIETVQFQQFFADVLADKSRQLGEYLPVEEIQSRLNKDVRIQSLQPFIKNKYIKFNKKHKTLLQQLTEYPMGKNDDGPDALEMALRLALSVGTGNKINYKTVIGRALSFKKGAY